MYDTREFKKGLKVELDGAPYSILDFQHISPGKGSAFTRTKLKNLLTGNTTEKTFKSGEKVPPADVQQREMQFLYADATDFHFMDNTSYEQMQIGKDVLGDAVGYLQENIVLLVMLYNGRPIDAELPNFIEAKVVETEPAIRGDTVSGGTKPAKLETGATVSVPFHIKEGDLIKVDTRNAAYVEKVNR